MIRLLSKCISGIPLSVSLGLMAFALSCAGCGIKQSQKSFIKDCVLPSDQSGTLNAHWRSVPIPLAIYRGSFTDAEATEILKAVDTWNEFFESSLNLQILDAGTPRTSAINAPDTTQLCTMSIVNGDRYTQPVVIYKDTSWPYSSQTDAMAITSYCKNDTTPLKTFYMAVMELNYQYYFTTSKVPDLQTIVLHELGHLVGLNHSCDNSGGTGVPRCSGAGSNPAYRAAVMYPVFGFPDGVHGEQRRELTENDQGRANCLYQ